MEGGYLRVDRLAKNTNIKFCANPYAGRQRYSEWTVGHCTQQCNVLCSLLAATSQCSVLIGQRNQLIN